MFVVHRRVLHRGMDTAKPSGLRGGRTRLHGSLGRRVHQLPIGIGGVERREARGQILSDAHLDTRSKCDTSEMSAVLILNCWSVHSCASLR